MNNNRVFRWILILEDCGTEIEYIEGNKNTVEDSLSQFSYNWNQKTAHESNYIIESMS